MFSSIESSRESILNGKAPGLPAVDGAKRLVYALVFTLVLYYVILSQRQTVDEFIIIRKRLYRLRK